LEFNSSTSSSLSVSEDESESFSSACYDSRWSGGVFSSFVSSLSDVIYVPGFSASFFCLLGVQTDLDNILLIIGIATSVKNLSNFKTVIYATCVLSTDLILLS
jgi:hypothetical protein